VGGFFGLQGQWGQVVLGVEGHLSGTTWNGRYNAVNDGPNADCLQGLAGVATVSCRGRIDRLVTLGPKIGFVPASHWLLFATGGLAYARLDTSVRNLGTGLEIGRSRRDQGGWFLGGGVDYAFTRNFLIGIEYQHVDLRAVRHLDDYFGCCNITAETRDMRGSLDIIRLRLTYKTAAPPPAIVHK
jgi:outer membrane immunogenic protein